MFPVVAPPIVLVTVKLIFVASMDEIVTATFWSSELLVEIQSN